MNLNDLVDAIGTADEKLLEKSERPLKKQLRPWIAIAACLCLIITAVFFFLQPPCSHNIISPKISWDFLQDLEIKPYDNFGGQANSVVPNYTVQYEAGIIVQGRILEILPDTYTVPSRTLGRQTYRIARIQRQDVLFGKNIPYQFYYLLPTYLSADIENYDTFLFSIFQFGLEDFLMINVSQNQLETFSFLFYSLAEYQLSVLPYSDGKLDLSLWEKDGWDEHVDELNQHMGDGRDGFPIKFGYTIKQAKQAIIEHRENNSVSLNPTVIERLELQRKKIYNWKEAKELNAYIAKGIFAQEPHWRTPYSVIYTRIIDGFWTNEQYVMYHSQYDSETQTYLHGIITDGVQFTEDDLKNLPDLASVVADYMRTKPTDMEDVVCNGIGAYYQKVGDDVFGYMCVTWRHRDDIVSTTTILVFEDGRILENDPSISVYLEEGLEAGMEAEKNAANAK